MPTFEDIIQHCEQEKLHLSGAIQGRGALLRVDAAGSVTHVSSSILACTACPAEALLGRSLSIWPDLPLPPGNFPEAPGATWAVAGIYFPKQPAPMDIRFVRDIGGGFLIEIEPHISAASSNIYELRKPLVLSPQGTKNTETFSAALLAAFQALSGFDRIMIYRFHDDWSGEVVAERTSATFGSYLGLRFPASDIPAIARNLYQINPCRYIHDVEAATVHVHGYDDEAIDLTYTDLRSVSPVHLAYLENMGVGASFSVSLLIAGKLWGLVACHHPIAKWLPTSTREACVSLARTYSITMGTLLAESRMQLIDQVAMRADDLAKKFVDALTFGNPLADNSAPIMDFLRASGLGCCVDGKSYTYGIALAPQALLEFDSWFVSLGKNMWITDSLSQHFMVSEPENPVCGIVALNIRTSHGPLRLYWFRQEELCEINWAGNPKKQSDSSGNQGILSPRKSFEKWSEIRSGHSHPWSKGEHVKLNSFRSALARQLSLL